MVLLLDRRPSALRRRATEVHLKDLSLTSTPGAFRYRRLLGVGSHLALGSSASHVSTGSGRGSGAAGSALSRKSSLLPRGPSPEGAGGTDCRLQECSLPEPPSQHASLPCYGLCNRENSSTCSIPSADWTMLRLSGTRRLRQSSCQVLAIADLSWSFGGSRNTIRTSNSWVSSCWTQTTSCLGQSPRSFIG